MIMKKHLLFLTLLLATTLGVVFQAQSAKTWTGTISNDWTVGGNWTGTGGPNPPNANDDVVLPASGANQNIINIPTGTFRSLSVTGGSYSFTGNGNITYTISGTYTFSVSSGASFTLLSSVNLIVGGTSTIDGSFTADGNFTANSLMTVSASGVTHLNSAFTFGANVTCNGFLHLNGTYYSTAARIISGTGTVFVDAGETLTLSGDLNVNTTDFTYNGFLNIPLGFTFTRTGNMTANTGSATDIIGTMHVTGDLTLNMDASLIQGLGSGTLTVDGSTYTKLAFDADSTWHYFAFPTPISHSMPLVGHYVMYYTESNYAWHYIIAPLPMDSTWSAVGKGYAIWPVNMTPITFAGPLDNGDYDVPVTRTYIGAPLNGYNGWNLVGNPYPSALDLSTQYGDWTNMEPWAYFWNHAGGNYLVWGNNPGPPYGTHTQYAPALQGFFVKVTATGNPSTGNVHFDNGHRVHSEEQFLKEGENPVDLLKLQVQNEANGYYDQVSVYFNDATTAGYDEDFDAEKLPGDQNAPQLYTTVPGYQLTVNGMPPVSNTAAVPLAFTSTLGGTFTLNATEMESFNPDVDIILVDLTDNSTQDLRAFPAFTFSHDPANDPNRFLILFTDLLTGVNGQVPGSNPVQVFAYNDLVYVNMAASASPTGTVTITDMLGRQVFTGTATRDHVNTFRMNVPDGYYVVRVITGSDVSTQKVYLR
jgi:hypothetical protein